MTKAISRKDVVRSSLLVTAVSVVFSLLMTSFSLWAIWGVDPARVGSMSEIWSGGLMIGAVVPLCVAPVVSWRLLVTNEELNLARSELARLARSDPMTGLLNRRGFAEAAEAAIRAAAASQAPVALLVCDIDHFMAVNDTCGNDAGDRAIRHVAGQLVCAGQGVDAVLWRHGGEEFCLLVTGLSIRQALALAETARRACAEQPLMLADGPLPLTVSIGLAMAIHDDAELAALMARADAALYRAKAEGRNRVERAVA